MRTRSRDVDSLPVAAEEARYCLLCETFMTFEQVDDAEECWICVKCGSAVWVDPPIQLAG